MRPLCFERAFNALLFDKGVLNMLEYPSIWGLLPLIVYIVLSFTRFNQLVAVSASVLLGAVMSGQTVLSTARAIQGGLGSFLTYVGLIILLGAGLGEVLNRTGVVKNLVYLVTKKMGVNSPQKAILTTMISSVLLVSLLGTLAGANAIIAPILIPIVAAVGITPSTLAVVFHGAGATGLFLGPFTPPVVALMGFTGITYPQVLLNAGLPISIIMWIITFVVALFIQKRTQGKYSYTAEDLESTELENWKPEGHVNRATLVFLITMGAMVAYGIILKGGSSFAVAVMLITAVITGIAGKMSLNEIFDAICHGASRLMWLFFLFVMFNPFIQFVSETGAFTALANMLQPLIEKSGPVGFLGLSMLVGVFGIPGAAVAQLQVIHEMFLPLVEQLQIPMTLWALVLLVGSQMTFFAFPGGDMIGEMGLARSKDLKSMVINGLILTVAVAGYVMLRAFFAFH
jgi:H+/gluconate symporter-like permease